MAQKNAVTNTKGRPYIKKGYITSFSIFWIKKDLKINPQSETKVKMLIITQFLENNHPRGFVQNYPEAAVCRCSSK